MVVLYQRMNNLINKESKVILKNKMSNNQIKILINKLILLNNKDCNLKLNNYLRFSPNSRTEEIEARFLN